MFFQKILGIFPRIFFFPNFKVSSYKILPIITLVVQFFYTFWSIYYRCNNVKFCNLIFLLIITHVCQFYYLLQFFRSVLKCYFTHYNTCDFKFASISLLFAARHQFGFRYMTKTFAGKAYRTKACFGPAQHTCKLIFHLKMLPN